MAHPMRQGYAVGSICRLQEQKQVKMAAWFSVYYRDIFIYHMERIIHWLKINDSVIDRPSIRSIEWSALVGLVGMRHF